MMLKTVGTPELTDLNENRLRASHRRLARARARDSRQAARAKQKNSFTNEFDLPIETSLQSCCFKTATEAWELRGYARLRKRTFCDEQAIFEGSDHDIHDVTATPIVAISYSAVCFNEVVGCVRIHPDQKEGVWYGSRLGVAANWRGTVAIAAGLIRTAVCTAHARGCHRFLATVQRQNVRLFRRLHWRDIQSCDIQGRPHMLMYADLNYYPPRDYALSPELCLGRKAS